MLKQLQDLPQASCDSCTEYIKKMKGLEFRVADLIKEREVNSLLLEKLSGQIEMKDEELKHLKTELTNRE